MNPVLSWLSFFISSILQKADRLVHNRLDIRALQSEGETTAYTDF